MSGIATAIVGAAVVGGVASSVASKSAANTQANAQNNATNAQENMFNTIVGQEQPFMTAGVNATSGLSQLLGLTPGSFGGLPNGYLTQNNVTPFDASSVTNSPGYQFAQKQGLSQVANAEAPNVGALSGPALKALTNFSSGTAAQYYNDYFNQANTVFNQNQTQQNNIFSRLSAIAGLGQNAASNTGTAGTSLGGGIAQSTAAAGASQAAGTIGVGNAISGAAGAAGNGFALNSILGNNGAGSTADAGVPGWTPATGGT